MAESDQHLERRRAIQRLLRRRTRGAELARAEELLASRPECRQLLEEYRACGPVARSAAANAGKRVSSAQCCGGPSGKCSSRRPPSNRSAYGMSAPPKRTSPWPQGRRPWIYAAMAVAAAIVIMLAESKEDGTAGELAGQSRSPARLEMSAPLATCGGVDVDVVAAHAGHDAAIDRTANPGAATNMPRQCPAPACAGRKLRRKVAAKDGHDKALPDDMDVKLVLDQLGWPAISSKWHSRRRRSSSSKGATCCLRTCSWSSATLRCNTGHPIPWSRRFWIIPSRWTHVPRRSKTVSPKHPNRRPRRRSDRGHQRSPADLASSSRWNSFSSSPRRINSKPRCSISAIGREFLCICSANTR